MHKLGELTIPLSMFPIFFFSFVAGADASFLYCNESNGGGGKGKRETVGKIDECLSNTPAQ